MCKFFKTSLLCTKLSLAYNIIFTQELGNDHTVLGATNRKSDFPTGHPVSPNGERSWPHRMDSSSSTLPNSKMIEHDDEDTMNLHSEVVTTSEL